MNKEQSYFISILSDHLKGEGSERRPEIYWDEIARLARIHQVEGILYIQCKEFIPENMSNEYHDYYLKTVYSYANRKALMNSIASILNESGIAFYTVKGFNLAQYYPCSALRTMGDCDIVVHRYDFPMVVKLLRANGFSGSDITSTEQWECDKNGFHFEIHDRLLQEGEYATRAQSAFLNNFDKYINNGVIDPSFHFVFLLMHLRKHFLNHGVGIRQFMDLAVMCQKEANLQWEWIEETLNKLGLRKYAHACYFLVERWFRISIPVEKEDLSEDAFKRITEKILNNGVFGFNDSENSMANAHTALLKAKGPLWVRRATVLLQSTFLSYEVMRGYADCGFLDGKPWLLPIAWIKRWCAIIRRRDNTKPIEVIKNSFISISELDDRKDLLEKMGLL